MRCAATCNYVYVKNAGYLIQNSNHFKSKEFLLPILFRICKYLWISIIYVECIIVLMWTAHHMCSNIFIYIFIQFIFHPCKWNMHHPTILSLNSTILVSIYWGLHSRLLALYFLSFCSRRIGPTCWFCKFGARTKNHNSITWTVLIIIVQHDQLYEAYSRFKIKHIKYINVANGVVYNYQRK